MRSGIWGGASFSCVKYTSCLSDYPIVFCTSEGFQHDAQTGSAVPGFWEFFKSFRTLL